MNAKSGRSSRRRLTLAERITIGIGASSLIVAVIGLLLTQLRGAGPEKTGSAQPDSPRQSSVAPSATRATPPAPSGPAPATFLDTLVPQTGQANLVELPRALRGQPGYDHPVAIRCPSNQNGDPVTTVNYLLRGRQLDFSADVRPYFTTQPDARAHIFALIGVRQRDGSLTQTQRGYQYEATMARPAPLTADVEGAEELILQVRCEHPEGMIILVNARLTGE